MRKSDEAIAGRGYKEDFCNARAEARTGCVIGMLERPGGVSPGKHSKGAGVGLSLGTVSFGGKDAQRPVIVSVTSNLNAKLIPTRRMVVKADTYRNTLSAPRRVAVQQSHSAIS